MIRSAILSLSYVTLTVLGGCATAPIPPVSAETRPNDQTHVMPALGATPLPNGAWIGRVSVSDSKDAHNDKPWEVVFVLYSCDGISRYYISEAGSNRFETPDPALSVQSYYGSHHFFFAHTGMDEDNPKRGWVEVQAADVIELSPTSATIRWTRAISNRDIAMDHPSRALFTQGLGTLHRHGNECRPEALGRVKGAIFVPPPLSD